VVATGGAQGLRRRVATPKPLARRRHRVTLTSYGYNSKFTIKGNRKLLTTYVIITTWQLLISANALRSLSGV
jgi:hypothetical protein